MLAWILRLLLMVPLLAGWIWYGAFRHEAFWISLAGFWVPPLLLVVTFILKFGMAAAVNRRDPAPFGSALDWTLACWRELWCVVKVFGWWQPLRRGVDEDWFPRVAGAQRGVVLIHGFLCNGGLWVRWQEEFKKEGRVHCAMTLEPLFGSIDGYAAQIDAAVSRITAATGLPPVLICHSMGGLAARAWLRSAGPEGGHRVRHVITLGTPHHGTWLARFSGARNGRQMRHDSPWVRELSDTAINRAPGFTCWYSNCDNIVFPATTATLEGATNRLAAGLGHIELALDESVMKSCLALIRAS